MKRFFNLLLLLTVIANTDCVTARKVSPATDLQLHLQTASPQKYRIRVATPGNTNDFTISETGRTTIHIPPMGPGCDSHLFGLIQMYDDSPFTWPVVHLMRDDIVIRKFSLKQLARLPQGGDGYRTILTR